MGVRERTHHYRRRRKNDRFWPIGEFYIRAISLPINDAQAQIFFLEDAWDIIILHFSW